MGGGIDAIGGTPVVRLERRDGAEIWVKLEAANPTGSYSCVPSRVARCASSRPTRSPPRRSALCGRSVPTSN